MNYYGFDGWFFNVEQPSPTSAPPGFNPTQYRVNLLKLVLALDATLYQQSNGTQQDYQARELQFWAGGRGVGPNAGIGSVAAARPVSLLPLTTSFCTGNGTLVAIQGQVVSTNEWRNLSMQDVLPTWRFGIRPPTPAQSVDVQFDYSYAYEGGCSLLFQTPADGTAAPAEVDLFFAQILVDSALEVSYAIAGQLDVFLTLYLTDGTWLVFSDPAVFPTQPSPLGGGSGTVVPPRSITTTNGWTNRVYSVSLGGTHTIERISLDLYSTDTPYATNLGQLRIAGLDADTVPAIISLVTQGAGHDGHGRKVLADVCELLWTERAPNPGRGWRSARVDVAEGDRSCVTRRRDLQCDGQQRHATLLHDRGASWVTFIVQPVGTNGVRQPLSDARQVTVVVPAS